MLYTTTLVKRMLETTEMFPKYNTLINRVQKAYKKDMPTVTIKFRNQYYDINFENEENFICDNFPYYCCVCDTESKKIWFIDRDDFEKFETIINVNLIDYLIEYMGYHLIKFY